MMWKTVFASGAACLLSTSILAVAEEAITRPMPSSQPDVGVYMAATFDETGACIQVVIINAGQSAIRVAEPHVSYILYATGERGIDGLLGECRGLRRVLGEDELAPGKAAVYEWTLDKHNVTWREVARGPKDLELELEVVLRQEEVNIVLEYHFSGPGTVRRTVAATSQPDGQEKRGRKGVRNH